MKKKWILCIVLICLAVGITAGFLVLKPKSVEVQAVSDLQMMYYSDPNSTVGYVYDAQSQKVYVDANEKLEEVYVTSGQQVHAGDPLLKKDTSSLQLSLSIKEIEAEKIQNEISGTQNTLQKLKNTKPDEEPVPTPVPTTEPEPSITPEPVPEKKKVEDAYTLITSAEDRYTVESEKETEGKSVSTPLHFLVTEEGKISTEVFDSLKTLYTDPVYVSFECHENNQYTGAILNSWVVRNDRVAYAATQYFTLPGGSGISTQNALISDGGISLPVESDSSENTGETSGYTAVELAKAIQQCEASLRSLQIDLKRKQLEIQEVQSQLEDGIVYCKKDGVVVEMGDIENPSKENKPFLTVSMQKGTYIQGLLPELVLDTLKVGDSVTVTSWMTGSSYSASVQSIDTYPTDNSNYSSDGNPNCSYYAFYACIEEDTDLNLGDSLNVTMNTDTATDSSLWLESPYVRLDDQDEYYVYKEENGKLVKQIVQVGKIDYGSMVQITSGITSQDYIAFPYGKHVKPGAVTKHTAAEGGTVMYG